MAKIKAPRKGKKAVTRMDTTDLFRVIQRGLLDERIWCRLAVVVVPEGEDSHFEIKQTGSKITAVLVDVETAPEGEDVTAKLSSSGGLWRIPKPGTEVIVSMPSGKQDFFPTIVAVLEVDDEIPGRVSDQRTILVAPDVVEIQAPIIKIGPDPENIVEASGPTQDSIVHGSGIDSFTGTAYSVLGNATTKVFVRK